MSTLITVIEVFTKGFNPDGTTFLETLYFSSHPYRPPLGPPPGGGADIDPAFIPVILTSPLKAFSMGCVVWDSRPLQTLGDLELINANGKLDYLLTRDSKDLEANYFQGYADADFNTFIKVASLIQNRFTSSAQDRIKLSFVDRLAKLEGSIPMDTYSTNIPNVNLRGAPVPKVWGSVLSVKLEAYDKPNEIFTATDESSLNGIPSVYANGVLIPEGVGASTYAEVAITGGYLGLDFVSNTVSQAITMDAEQYSNNSYENLISNVIGAYSIDMDEDNLAQFEVDNPYSLGVSITAPTPGREVLDYLVQSVNAWYFQDNLGLIKLGQLKEPQGNPKVFISLLNSKGDFIKTSDEAKGLRSSLAYQKNWYPMEDTQIAANVPDATRDLLLADHRGAHTNAGLEYQVNPFYDFANSAEALDTSLSVQAEALEALRLHVCLFTSRRWFYSTTAIIDATEISTLEPGDVLALSQEDYNLTDPYDIDIHGQPLADLSWLQFYVSQLAETPGDSDPLYTGYDEGYSLFRILSNPWRTLIYPYNITPDTVLEFDINCQTGTNFFGTSIECEALCIGVCTVAQPLANAELATVYQVHGTSTLGDQTYNGNYVNNSGWKRYKIPIGKQFEGEYGFIRIISKLTGFDIFTKTQDTEIRNLRLREDGFIPVILIGAEFNLGGNKAKLTTWGA